MLDFLPDRSKSRALELSDRVSPLIYAGGLIGLGALLLWAKPRIGEVPKAALTERVSGSRRRRLARSGRDAVGALAPSNVTDSVGRSLVVGGLALMLARLLDEAS